MIDSLGVAVAVVAATVTMAVTPVVAFVVLRRFRRAVAQSMLAASADPSRSTREVPRQRVNGSSVVAAQLLELPRDVSSRRGPLATLATEQVRRAICWYVVAGAAYAATQTGLPKIMSTRAPESGA